MDIAGIMQATLHEAMRRVMEVSDRPGSYWLGNHDAEMILCDMLDEVDRKVQEGINGKSVA